MERSDGGGDEIWGTWEELLLASAVGRHGTGDWGSVAAAVGERTSFPNLLTAEVCERRYRDLCHRFQVEACEIDEGGDGDPFAVPWLEELRRLRVAELRREVQRYDVSIVSLQLKVKKLTEERQRSLRDSEDAGADARDPEESHRTRNGHVPVAAAGGERSGRSCNESNSPEPKEGEGQTREPEKPTGEGDQEEGTQPAEADPVTAGEDKAAGEGSCNGSSETVVVGKGAGAATAAAGAGDPIGRPPESGESMAESTGEEAAKESSDVQSSISPSRRRKRGGRRKPPRGTASGGNSEGDSPEAKGDPSGKSQPLVVVLEIIRSKKYGSVFERRLDSQDSSLYRSLIRQHMDLETVGKKLEEGPSYTSTEFFRDLFLICANAAVFFPKDSPEHNAATHLRNLVNAEFVPFNQKSPSLLPQTQAAEAPTLTPPQPPAPRPPVPQRQPTVSSIKSESETHTSLLDKVASNPLLSICRKRSSLSTKAATATVKDAREEASPAPAPTDEKPKVDLEKEMENVEKKAVMKEKPVARGLRTTKTRGSAMKKPTLPGTDANPRLKLEAKEDNAMEPMRTPMEKKGSSGNLDAAPSPPVAVAVAKKRSAASFLNRLRGSSAAGSGLPLPNGEKVQAAKNAEAGGTKVGGEHKKGSVKEDRRKEKQEPVKRSVGRPPKRPPPTPPSQPSAKRAREAEATPPSAGKKRGRR